MTTYITNSPQPETETEIFYPSSDGEPIAETYDHLLYITNAPNPSYMNLTANSGLLAGIL
jgi:hypothetical protein